MKDQYLYASYSSREAKLKHKKELSGLLKFSIALVALIALVGSAMLLAFWYNLDGHLHANPPTESFRYRTVEAKVNSKGDTMTINIIDKRVYFFKTMDESYKQQLRDAIK